MYDTARRWARAELLRTRPDAAEAEIQKLLFLRYYERDLTPEQRAKVFAAIDNVHGER